MSWVFLNIILFSPFDANLSWNGYDCKLIFFKNYQTSDSKHKVSNKVVFNFLYEIVEVAVLRVLWKMFKMNIPLMIKPMNQVIASLNQNCENGYNESLFRTAQNP